MPTILLMTAKKTRQEINGLTRLGKAELSEIFVENKNTKGIK
jgi:hypothetical protein